MPASMVGVSPIMEAKLFGGDDQGMGINILEYPAVAIHVSSKRINIFFIGSLELKQLLNQIFRSNYR